jgi:hypothetical protein
MAQQRTRAAREAEALRLKKPDERDERIGARFLISRESAHKAFLRALNRLPPADPHCGNRCTLRSTPQRVRSGVKLFSSVTSSCEFATTFLFSIEQVFSIQWKPFLIFCPSLG